MLIYIYFIFLLIERAVVHSPQATNNMYVTTIYYHYSNIPYISYEDPVQITTTTTDSTSNTTNATTPVVADPYHISGDEVCILITTCLYSNRYLS